MSQFPFFHHLLLPVDWLCSSSSRRDWKDFLLLIWKIFTKYFTPCFACWSSPELFSLYTEWRITRDVSLHHHQPTDMSHQQNIKSNLSGVFASSFMVSCTGVLVYYVSLDWESNQRIQINGTNIDTLW